jgi:hypothetical protein
VRPPEFGNFVLLHIDKEMGYLHIDSDSPIKPFSVFSVACRRKATSTPLEILVE